MSSTKKYDTLVLGNGALGLALGFELTKHGQRVALIGPGDREYSASKAAGAMNGCFGEVTHNLLSNRYGRAKIELDIEATALWDDWIEEIAAITNVAPSLLRQKNGTSVILNAVGTSAIDSLNFRSIQRALDEYNGRYSILNVEDVRWIYPQENGRPFEAMHIHDEHYVDTSRYLPALETAFQHNGGCLIKGLVDEINVSSATTANTIRLGDGSKYSADNIVLAAGVFSHKLLSNAFPRIAARVPPMIAGSGVAVMIRDLRIRPLDRVIRTPNRAFACGLHVVPREKSVYLGATNALANTPRLFPNVSDVHFLLDCAMKQLHTNFSSGSIAQLHVGNRPIPVDGFPLIGALLDTNLWMMTGTYRDGFHLSPLLAKRMAKTIMEEEQGLLPPEFTPVRQPIQAANRRQVVKAAADHMLAAGYEADWRISVKWTNRLRGDLERKYAALADELHQTITPPAEILAFSFENPWLQKLLRVYYSSYTPNC